MLDCACHCSTCHLKVKWHLLSLEYDIFGRNYMPNCSAQTGDFEDPLYPNDGRSG